MGISVKNVEDKELLEAKAKAKEDQDTAFQQKARTRKSEAQVQELVDMVTELTKKENVIQKTIKKQKAKNLDNEVAASKNIDKEQKAVEKAKAELLSSP